MRKLFKLCILFLLLAVTPASAASVAICRVPMYEGVCCSHFTSDYDFGNGMCCGGMPYLNTNLCPWLIPPTAAPISPPSASVNMAQTFSASVSDAGGSVASCNFIVDGSDKGAMACTPAFPSASCTATKDFTFTSAGTYSVKARCMDNDGNTADGITTEVVVSTGDTAPTVGLVTPNSATTGSNIVFSASVSDNNQVNNCNFIVGGVDKGAMSCSPAFPSASCTASRTHSFEYAGTYYVYVRCSDNTGHTTDGASVDVTVSAADTSSPSISSVYSSPNPVQQGNLVMFYADISDPSGILRNPPTGNDPIVCSDASCSTKYCEMGNGGVGDTYSCQHNTISNTPGNYNYIISAKDTLGNSRVSPTDTFTVSASSCSYGTKASCEGVSSCHWCGASSACSSTATSFICQSNADCGSVNDSCSGGNWYDYNKDGVFNSAGKTCGSCTSCNNPTPTTRGKDSAWCSNCDSSTPSTLISPPSSSSWYSSAQTITLTSSDDCSKTIYYKIDLGPTQTYSAPFSALEGSHTYTYWAVDSKGNTESQKTATIKVDTTDPTCTISAPASWQNSDASVSLGCTDGSGSGCDSNADYWCTNSVDSCSPATPYTSTVSVSSHQYFRGKVTDNAGHSTICSRDVLVDKTAPSVNVELDKTTRSSFSRNATVTDSGGSGVSSYSWSKASGPGIVTFGTPDEPSTTISANADGTYVIRLTVTDLAGNSAYDEFTLVWDTTPPVTTDNSDSAWHDHNITISLSCTDALSGCDIYYCKYPAGGPTCASYTNGNLISIGCGQGSNCEWNISYRSTDGAGNVEAFKSPPYTIKIDKTTPQLFSLSEAPDPFSPNGDSIKDTTRVSYITDTETDGMGYNVTIDLSGPSGFVRTLVNKKPITGVGHFEEWDGKNEAETIMPDGVYIYNVKISDRIAHTNSSSGYVRIDLTPPDFDWHSTISPTVELGDSILFSATVSDISGVDHVAVCPTPTICYGQPTSYCNMGKTQFGTYFCSYEPITFGNYNFYLVANDTQGLTSSVLLQTRVRSTSLVLDTISPNPVDLQGLVSITVNYSENSTYPITSASCTIAGDVSGTFSPAGGPYSTTVPPSRLETNSFTITCSDGIHPPRSVSSSFTARDLSIELDYDYDPLAEDQTNYLYSKVRTISQYSKVQNANKASFNVTRDSDGLLVEAGDFVWNATNDRWEANFTPPDETNYTAQTYFNSSVGGGTFDGFTSVRMGTGKGVKLSTDISNSVAEIGVGSSAIITLFVENRRSRDVSYNITMIGDLSPVSFDGQALLSSGRRYSTFGFVPAKSIQSHPLLIQGLEVSPTTKETIIRFKETQPPYNVEEVRIYYQVLSVAGDMKFAPELDLHSLLLIVSLAVAFIRHNSSCPRMTQRKRQLTC